MKIIIIGDIILDINYNCISNRNAPEALNIPIFNITETNYLLGGVANIANNLNNLKNCDIELISVIGKDNLSDKLIELLKTNNIKNKLFIEKKRITTQKYRLFKDNILYNRFDLENTYDISSNIENDILNYIKSISDINAIIISDYNKGLITNNLCKNLIDYCNNNNILSFIDPKIKNIEKYKNSYFIKPNYYEAIEMSKETYIFNIIDFYTNKLNIKNIIITNGDDGSYLYNNNKLTHINKKYNYKLVDVTGCGDIYLSIFVYSFLNNNNMILSANIANYIANKNISVIGNYITNNDDILLYEITDNNIIYETEIDKIKLIKNNYDKITFTNGCFDIIHAGHIKLLQFAKKKGEILIVGLNSDNSIKQIKGENRPINNIKLRIELLKSLNIIDYIIIFDNLTPYNIIKELKPYYLIKGSDYKEKKIIGKEYVKEILIYESNIEISTSIIINKINEYN